jgi:hypothetical protein
MGNSTSRSDSTDLIQRSEREAQIASILQNTSGGYSEEMGEINVQFVDLAGGGGCGRDTEDNIYMRGGGDDDDFEDEINVQFVDLVGGNPYHSDMNSEIDVKFIDLQGGASKHADEDHMAIYKEIKNRINAYQQKGGSSSSNNEFFDMLEKKLNGVESDSPFMSSQKNKFAEALQKGGYRDYSDTETATVTAKKLLNTIVQMGGEDSSESEDSDFTSTDGSSGEEESSSSDKSEVTTDTFAILPVKTARRQKQLSDSEEEDYNDVMSSSLETDDINLISYSPRQ